jgi:hypothetical protein
MFIGANAFVGRRCVAFAGSELHPDAPGTSIRAVRLDADQALTWSDKTERGDGNRTASSAWEKGSGG